MDRVSCSTPLFLVVCTGVDESVCREVCGWLERLGLERVVERVNPLAAEARRALGTRYPLVIVSTGVSERLLEEVGAEVGVPGLSRLVAELRRRGVEGAVMGAAAVVLVEPGEAPREAVAKALEEAFHLVLGLNPFIIYEAAGGIARDDMDAWLIEEEAVHQALLHLGLMTREEYEEMRRRYEDEYRRATGREPPPGYQRAAARLAELLLEGAATPA